VRLPSALVPARFEARFKPLRFPETELRQTLGWTPPVDFQTALRRTIEAERADG
jgi:UDP-glucose 4-epimerase